MLPMQGAWVWFLVRELRSHMLHNHGGWEGSGEWIVKIWGSITASQHCHSGAKVVVTVGKHSSPFPILTILNPAFKTYPLNSMPCDLTVKERGHYYLSWLVTSKTFTESTMPAWYMCCWQSMMFSPPWMHMCAWLVGFVFNQNTQSYKYHNSVFGYSILKQSKFKF